MKTANGPKTEVWILHVQVYLCAQFLEIFCQDVILTAIKDEGAAFEYASEELKNDYHFALEVVSMGGPGQEKVGDVLEWNVILMHRP